MSLKSFFQSEYCNIEMPDSNAAAPVTISYQCYTQPLKTSFSDIHAHPYLEVILVTDGCAVLTYNHKKMTIKKGDLLFIPQGISHFETWKLTFGYYALGIKNYNIALQANNFIFKTETRDDTVLSYFKLLFKEFSQKNPIIR